MVYRKPSGAFLTIESEFIRDDENYIYLACGKYLYKNIIGLAEVVKVKEKEEDNSLVDDA
jgi:hypothetical protein